MAQKRYAHKTPKFFFSMDAAYDIKAIYDMVINRFKATPLISFNMRGAHGST